MLKFTDEKHKDKKNLDEAFEKIEMVVSIFSPLEAPNFFLIILGIVGK